MAYEDTSVPVHKSQGEIAALIMSKGGTAVGFVSEPPREGFNARIKIDGTIYGLRITACCRTPPLKRKGRNRYCMESTTELWRAQFAAQELRRVWRVLFYYLKNAFECADAGVVELREVLMPHIVMPDNRTIAEHILPRLAEAVADPARLLTAGGIERT